MNALSRIGAALLMICAPAFAQSALNCTISEFEIEAYDHGGVYIHGKLNGTPVGWIVICGAIGVSQDCPAKATDRRLAVALAAQAQGKNLLAHFASLNACTEYTPYTIVAGLRTVPN